MLVKDVMTREVEACHPENNLAQLAEIMWEKRCGALPVIDGAEMVIGVVTDRDICIALGTRNLQPAVALAGDISHPKCVTCDPEDDLRFALKLMSTEQVSRLPVLDESRHLIGMLSIDDVVYRAGGGCSNLNDAEIVKAIRGLLEQRVHQVPESPRAEAHSDSGCRLPLNSAPEELPWNSSGVTPCGPEVAAHVRH